MNKQEAYDFYQQYREKCAAYELAATTIFFDMSTIAPENGNDYRIKMLSVLSGELFDYQTSEENIKKIEEISTMDLDEITKKEIQYVLKKLRRISLLPRDFYIHKQQLSAKGEEVWKKAKKENDYSLFKDILKELVETEKQTYRYYGVKEEDLYDAMLDEHETGMNTKKYDEFFALIKEKLVPFIHRLNTEATQIDDSALYQHYPTDKQEKVMQVLKDYMGFNPKECYMGVSAHPFTCCFSSNDVRITNEYLENSLISSVFSIIHEYGHALYMLHVSDKLQNYSIGQAMTSGMHESQSRFLENYIGKRRSFWVQNFSHVKDIFPEQLKDVSLDDFIQMMNVSRPSLIRTEADELTYPLHILIRYELEKEMVEGKADFEHLDEIWADRYEKYIGVRPTAVSEGILQDIHWSDGSFGYFPTYALGSAFAAQFFEAMCQDIHVDEALENNQFFVIENWLKEHIHQYGALYTSEEILNRVCGKGFDPNVYIDYLIHKFSTVYQLKKD